MRKVFDVQSAEDLMRLVVEFSFESAKKSADIKKIPSFL